MVKGVFVVLSRQAFWRSCLGAFCFLAALGAVSDAAKALPGDPDRSFGKGGLVSIAPESGAQPVLRDLVQLPNGKLLVSGGSKPQQSGILARFERNGSPDESFGTGGIVRTPHSLWAKLVPIPGQKALAFGRSGQDPAIARFNSDGSLDHGFGDQGIRILDLRSEFGETEATLEARGAGVDSAGRPVAVVEVGTCSLDDEGDVERTIRNLDSEFCGDTALVRLTNEGALDPSFGGGDGIRIIATPGGESAFNLTPYDDILIASVAFHDSGDIDVPNQGWRIIQRLYPDGSLDPAFGRNGWAVFRDETDHPMAGLLQADDEGALTVSFDGTLMRLLENGRPDGSFGRDGVAKTGIAGLAGRNRLNIHLGDGAVTKDHIYLAGSASYSKGRVDERWSVVIRLNPDGTPDPTFSNDGLAGRRIGPFVKYSLLERRIGMLSGGFVVDDTGRPLVGATGGPAENLRFTLARFKSGKGKRLMCDGRPATVQGTSGNDRLVAGAVTVTGGGDDVVTGGARLICTGRGDDRVRSRESGKVLLGPGSDSFTAKSVGYEIFGGDGDDRILGRNMLASGGDGDDLIDATRPNDRDWALNDKRLVGGPGRDKLFSNRGRDTLLGGAGPDLLRSGAEEDRLVGGPGDDALFGEAAADVLLGGPGRDRLDGGPAGPDYHRYWVDNDRARGLLELLPDQIGRENLRFRVKCRTWSGGARMSWAHSYVIAEGLEIRNNRFRGSYRYDTGFGYAGDETTGGRITPRWVSITVHDFEDEYDGTTCTARNLKFKLKRIPKLRQIVRP